MTHLQQQGDLVRPGSLETFSKQETSESLRQGRHTITFMETWAF